MSENQNSRVRAMPSEEWRVVMGSNSRYNVSNLGRVKNVDTGRLLFGELDRYGYRAVNLVMGDKKVKRRVHRLVCEAFHGQPHAGWHAAHLDGDPLNNAANNLAWKTPRENNADKLAHGTHQAGERHPRVKLTAAQVAEIRAARIPTRALSAEYGVAQSQIVRIKNGARWRS